MADLGSRLLEAGLVTRAQLHRALENAPPHGGALARELVHLGVEEDAIAGFFLAAGYGPLLDGNALEGADPNAVARLSRVIAEALIALPVRASPAGLVVAMVDPSDKHSVDEIRFAVGQTVLPVVARLSDLHDALDRCFPERRPRADGAVAGDGEGDGASEEPMPLVRPKTPAALPRTIAKAFPKPPDPGPPPRASRPRRKRTEDFDRKVAPGPRRKRTEDFERVVPGRPAAKGALPEDQWGELASPSARPEPPPVVEVAPKLPRRLRRSLADPPPESQPPDEIGPILAGIRGAGRRDDVARLACEGAATVGRCAVLLALRKGTLRGLAAAGAHLSRDAVRNLHIPVRSDSLFQPVVKDGEEYLGPHGTAPADAVFRASIGARGGDVLLVPIVLSGKTAAVLCVDQLRFGERGRERVEVLAHAVGEAFERIIVQKKTG